jgi:two-component system response regulator QseB
MRFMDDNGAFRRADAMRILLVEDDKMIAEGVRKALRGDGFAVDWVQDGESALTAAAGEPYDLVLLDLGLPKRDGLDVLRTMRTRGLTMPVLIVTARDAVADRVKGLDAGADDYLVKPFEEEELVARVRALLRRGERPVKDALVAGALEIDIGARQARYSGKALALGLTEFRMLEFFARNAGLVLSREHLLERLWEYDFDGSSNIVDVYVSQLRRKLRRAGASDVIQTVWGVGYKFQP